MRLARTLVVSLVAALAGACTGAENPAPQRQSPAPQASANVAWRSLPDAPSARTEVVAVVVGAQAYVMGGYGADGGTVTTVEIFDTASGRWGGGPALPLAVNHAMAAAVKDKVYLFGGYQSNGAPSSAAFVLEPSGWRQVTAMPQPRGAATAAVVDDTVYIAGGVGANGLAQEMLAYSVSSDRWAMLPGPPTPREHLGGAGYGGQVYTVGGRLGGLDSNQVAFEAFDPKTGQWRQLPDLPTRRGGLSAAATASGWVVAVGGEAAQTFPEAEAFNVREGKWYSLPDLPTPRHGLGTATIGTVLYAFSGGPKPGLFVAPTVESIDLAPLG
jgi:N-acetylneuraminic acid mutarotase